MGTFTGLPRSSLAWLGLAQRLACKVDQLQAGISLCIALYAAQKRVALVV